MEDIASLFFEDDGAQQKLRAQALANALRGQQQGADATRAIGNLGLLTGDKVLGGFGQAQLQSANQDMGRIADQQQQLGQLGAGRLTRALQAQQLAKGKQELDDASAPASSIYSGLAKKFGFELPQGMTNQQAREALGLAEKAYAADMRARELALNREAMRGAKEVAHADKTQKELDKQIETLSKRLETAPALVGDLKTLQKFSGMEDIPGVGSFEGRLPNFLTSGDGTKVRQSVKGIVGTLIKERSGTAASDKEVERIMTELGMGDGATEGQFRLGLDRLIEQSQGLLRAKEAGASPEAVAEASRRGLTTSRDLPRSAPVSGAARVTRTDPTTGETRVWNGSSWVKE